MNKWLKIALITACCLIGIGLIIGVLGFAFGGDPLYKNEKTSERELVLNGEFTDIIIECERSAVVIRPAEDGVCRIAAEESESCTITAEIVGGRLEIRQKSKAKWKLNLFNFDFSVFKPYKLDLFLPVNEYNELKIDSINGGINISEGFSFKNARLETVSGGIKLRSAIRSNAYLKSISGGIEASGFSCEQLNANCTSGGVKLSDIKCASADIESISGSVDLTGVISAGELRVKTVSGSISFDRCDAGSIDAEAISGSIKGSLLSPKQFRASSISGKISVPENGGEGVCELETMSGRIEITIAE